MCARSTVKTLKCIDPLSIAAAAVVIVILSNSGGCSSKSEEMAFAIEYESNPKIDAHDFRTIDLAGICTGNAEFSKSTNVNRQINIQQVSNTTSAASLIPNGMMDNVKAKITENARKQYSIAIGTNDTSTIRYPLTCGGVYKCWTEEESRNGVVKFLRGGAVYSTASFAIPYSSQWKCTSKST